LLEILVPLAGFALITLAAGEIGKLFARVRLPLITGFLFTGIIAGPFILGLLQKPAITRLHFIDEVALAFIAFAAGSELYLKELRGRFRSITWVTIGLVIFTFTLGSLAVLALAEFIPFMQSMPVPGRLAVAMLAGTILVARSPSAAIAIINEMRAKGPFTQTVIGVTVIMDVVVITLFAINSSIATTIFQGLAFDLGFILLLLAELLGSLGVGIALTRLIQIIMSLRLQSRIKIPAILLAGYAIFPLSSLLQQVSHDLLPFEIHLEPLLICMITGFWITNFSNYRAEFSNDLKQSGLPIYMAFFTLTGASLNLDTLGKTWPIALALFGVRLLGISLGSFSGGVLAGEPFSHNRIRWMGFITQAGVALGLARDVAIEFPRLGNDFATIIIALVVLNEVIGPAFFKWSIQLVGESHLRAKAPEFDGVRDALIFGLERQALVLGRHLQAHGWQSKIAFPEGSKHEDFEAGDIDIHPLPDLTLESLKELEPEHADAIVCLLDSDEDNYRICELIYEHFGIDTVVVRLKDRTLAPRFQALGVRIVDPSTATVRLLEQFVRSPSATSLILGLAGNQDIAEFEVRDPTLHGITLRNLRLPLDTLILSVRRREQVLISHGYTELEVGDRVTVIGSPQSLEEVMLRFDI